MAPKQDPHKPHKLLTTLVALTLIAVVPASLPLAAADPTPDPYDVVISPSSQDAYPGDALRANVTLTANVTSSATVNISYVGPGLTARLDRTSLSAAAGNSTTTTLRVDVSSNASAGTRWVEIRTTQNLGNGTGGNNTGGGGNNTNGTTPHVEIDYFVVHIHERPVEPAFDLILSPGYVGVEAGGTARLNLTCSANVDATFWLTHNATPAGWNVTLSAYFCTASPGHNGTIEVEVHTPANATGSWTLDVTGWAYYDGYHQANATATIKIRDPPLFETRTCVLGSCIESTIPRPRGL